MKEKKQPLFKSIKFILTGIICVLSYTLWSQLNRTITLPVNNVAESKPLANKDVSLEEIKPDVSDVSDYDEIVNRPLFFEDRKPYVYVEPEKTEPKSRRKKQAATKKAEQYSLSAVMITADKKLALIQSGREKSLQRLSLGESIDGWILEEVGPRTILLKKDNETKKLELEIKTSAPRNKRKKAKDKDKDPGKKEVTQKSKASAESPNLKSETP